jgi:hypothetical protein
MDLIFGILKQLATTLTSTEFVLVISLIFVVAIVLATAFLKITGKSKGGGLLGLLTGGQDAEKEKILNGEILQKIDELTKLCTVHRDELLDNNSISHASITSHQMDIKEELIDANTVSMDKIMALVYEIRNESQVHESELKNHRAAMVAFKNELQQSSALVVRDLELIKQLIGRNDSADTLAHENVKQLIQRSQDIMQRVSSQLEKVDEFARAAVPEFRSYHKELSKEVGELNRDIALVERSIQTQINTSSVKLR